jgi:protein SCO1/2
MSLMTVRTSHIFLVISAFLAGLVVFLVVFLVASGQFGIGRGPGPSAIGGPFQLIDQNGKQITERDLEGRPFLVFFGYTHCPDVCPATLFDVSEMMRALGNDADRAGALFVTVDPERDTPAAMKDYLSSFDPHLRGATGDQKAIEAAEKSYRVYAKKVPAEHGDYSMDHTALVYLMDKQGRFVAPFNLKRRPEDAAADLRKYM